MTAKEFKYWAFLSYSPLDNCEPRPGAVEAGQLRWAEQLAATLKSFSVPAEFVGQPNSRGEIIPDRIDAVYQPAPTADPAADLSEADRRALEQSRCLIVICSPRSARDAQVNEAVRIFKQLGRGNRILPIVIAGEPNASDSTKPGIAPDAECFVPALLHPVAADGSLDATRSEAGYFFADARYGAERSEISARTELLAETELAIAKIHLLSGVIGVGFYGLWQREQKRRFVGFAEAQQQVREVQSQFEFARDQAQSAQAQLQALQAQARETLSQLEAARLEARAAQDRLLADQNVPLDLQTQIRAAQDKALEAQNRSQAMQNQIEALQAQSRASQEQLESARQQVQSAEQKSVEAQQQARIAQAQVEQARQQVRDTQQQLDAASHQLRAAQEQALAVSVPTPSSDAQPPAQELQNQLLAAQEQTRVAQAQVEAALSRAQAAEGNLVTAQAQAREAQQQILELQSQVRTGLAQLDEARHELRGAQQQIAEARQQARAAQDEVLQIRNQTREVQARIDAAQTQVTEAKNQSRVAQGELSATQEKVRASQRLTKVFAVLAVLAALAAGVIFSQHNASKTELAKRAATEASLSGAAIHPLDSEQIRQALLRMRGLDSFVGRIPTEKISETLNLAATILTEQQYNHLQDQLLAVWTRTNAFAAFEWSQQLTNETRRASVLTKTIPAMAADSTTNALVAFEWLQNPTNSAALPAEISREAILPGFFQRWARHDLAAAAAASEQLPGGETKAWIAQIILSQRIQNDPAAVASLVTNLPPGDHRWKIIAELSERWGQTEATNALAWLETLPGESDRSIAFGRIVGNWGGTDLSAATNWMLTLPEEKRADALLTIAYPWAQQDAPGLASYAFTLPAGEVQTRCLSLAVRACATNDLARAVELLQPLTNNVALRAQLLERAAAQIDYSRLPAAADFITTLPVPDQAAAVKGLVSQWSVGAPETALQWLRAFPETNAQPAQVEFVLNSWAQREPAAVAQWLANQPSDSLSEAMFTAFLAGTGVKYPEFAAHWTQTVADEAQRQKFQVQIARQWLKRDTSAAQKWIETLALPAEIEPALK